MISVIHLDDGREWRGGQHQVSLLAEGLAASGLRQIVATPPGSPLAEKMKAAGVVVEEIDFKGELDFASSNRIAELALASNFDLIHAHTAHAHAIGIRAGKRLRRSRPNSPANLVVTRRVDFPIARGFFSRRKYHYPHQHYIAISEAVCNVLIEGGVSSEKIEIVPSGVPPIPADKMLTRDASRSLFGIEPGQLAIVNVGALTDHKGHRYLIEAAAQVIRQFPAARFWILGEGELRGELENLAVQLGVADYVKMPGYVADARLKLAGFDLYVSSSHLEGMGTSILDAMLAELPVVAAAAGGVTDIVRPSVTGRLVPARDSVVLAQAICEELRLPEAQRKIAVKTAREFAEVNFSAERMVAGTLAVYQRLLGRRL